MMRVVLCSFCFSQFSCKFDVQFSCWLLCSMLVTVVAAAACVVVVVVATVTELPYTLTRFFLLLVFSLRLTVVVDVVAYVLILEVKLQVNKCSIWMRRRGREMVEKESSSCSECNKPLLLRDQMKRERKKKKYVSHGCSERWKKDEIPSNET